MDNHLCREKEGILNTGIFCIANIKTHMDSENAHSWTNCSTEKTLNRCIVKSQNDFEVRNESIKND